MSDPRKYSAEEMKRILEIASRSSPSSSTPAPAEDEGFTLAEIRDIAQEVGIDPKKVDRAAYSLTAASPVRSSVGLTTFQLERRVSRCLSVDEMKFIVQQADRFFGERGAVRHSERLLEWYAAKTGAFVGMASDGEGTRIRVIVDRARTLLFGGALGSILSLAVLGRLMPSAAGLPELVALVGTLLVVLGVLWAVTRTTALARLRRLLDLMESDLPSL